MQAILLSARRVGAICALALSVLLSASCGFLGTETKIDEGVVITPKVTIRSSTALAALNLAEVKRGDRLDILGQYEVKTPTRTNEWYKVRTKTKDATEGWIEARHVINKTIVDKTQDLFEKARPIISQGTGRLKVQTKLRDEAGGDIVTYLSRGTYVDIVGKTRAPLKSAKQPDNDDSDDTPDDEGARSVIWYLVRLPETEVLRAGWVGAQQVQLDVPDDILYLEGEGRRFTGWVVFDQSRTKKGELKDNYVALMKNLSTEGPIDFTRLWVITYSPERGRYDGSYIEDALRGVLPVSIHQDHRGFTIHELDENGKSVAVEYECVRTRPDKLSVRRLAPKFQIRKAPKKR